MFSTLTAWLIAGVLFAPQGTELPASQLRSRPDTDGPTRVEIGFYLADLTTVDGANQSFDADIVIQATWHDPRLAGVSDRVTRIPADGVWNPHLEIVNRRTLTTTLPEELGLFPDGTVRYVQRFIGTFSAAMDLREFPLDRQRFYVQVVSASGEGDSLIFAPYSGNETITGEHGELSISDWLIGPVRLEPAPFRIGGVGRELAGIAMVVDGERRLSYYIVQVILPLMMIVTMAWTVFWIAPTVVPTRIGTVVTTMLTLIAYRFALSNLVPRLPYLTRLDWFMLGSTSLILATLLTMAASAHLSARGRDELVVKIDRWGRVGFAACAVLIWTLPWVL